MFKKLLSDGLAAHQKGDLATAGELYRKALGLEPKNPDALNLMGVLMTQAGQLDTAITLLETAAKIAPDFAPIHVNLGNAYQAANRLDDAINAFTAAKMADISVTEAHVNLASALIAAGRADEALDSADIVIKLAPNAPDGYNFKGNALAELGRYDEAADLYGQAVDKKADFFEGWANLGGVHKAQGNTAAALRAFEKALDLNPTHIQTLRVWAETMIEANRAGEAEQRIITAINANPQAAALHHMLGVVRKVAGLAQAALQPIEGAIHLDPLNASYHVALGDALNACSRFDEARDTLNKAIALDPELANAHATLAETLYAQGHMIEAAETMAEACRLAPDNAVYQSNRGAYLLSAGHTEEALEALDELLVKQPGAITALNNRAGVLRKLGRLDDAIADVRTALNAVPDDPESLANLGALLEMSGRLDEALAPARRAVELAPDNAHAQAVLGVTLKALGDFTPAREHLERAVALDPQQPEANWSLGLLQLLEGDFENGWWNYRWRWRLEHRPCPYTDRKLWDGAPLNGSSILIHSEQGMGDAIQFARYLPLVAELGGRVTFTCHRPLVDLFTRAFSGNGAIDVVCHDDPVAMTDWHAPLLGLPYLFGTDLGSIPAAENLLASRSEGRLQLPPHPLDDGIKPRVGLVWSGNPLQRNDRNRSAPLEALAPLLENPNACFYSLQVGPNDADRAVLDGLEPLVDLSGHIQDFSDTTDLVDQLDLVISVCTSAAHLAGTMGKPTWVMLAHVPDFRWLLERQDCPWYPSARLFRQAAPGDWAGVVTEVAAQLADFPRPGS